MKENLRTATSTEKVSFAGQMEKPTTGFGSGIKSRELGLLPGQMAANLMVYTHMIK